MGKRELVLIAVFVALGIGIYQATAPPAPPGSDLSVGGIFQRMRRSMQGARETASSESQRTVAVEPGVQLVRINLPRPCDVTVTGSDRDDIAITLKTAARGYTAAEAKAAADAATVKDQTQGSTLVLTSAWEDRRGPAGFVTQATVSIALPRRLAVTMLPHIGVLNTSGVAAFEAVSSRGETHVSDVAGAVQVGHVGGPIEIRGGSSLKLTTRNGRGEVIGIHGPARIDATGGRIAISEPGGTLEIDSRNADITLEKIAALQGPFRYNGTGGSLRIDGLRVESRIDGRNTDLDVRLAAAAPVTIYNLGAITVTAPPGGYTLDAQASEGRIASDDSAITATPSDGGDARATAKIRGGGPALTLRATRGRIEIRRAGGAGK